MKGANKKSDSSLMNRIFSLETPVLHNHMPEQKGGQNYLFDLQLSRSIISKTKFTIRMFIYPFLENCFNYSFVELIIWTIYFVDCIAIR